MKRWINQYFYSCGLLHLIGKRAWPWNVRIAWSEAGKRLEKARKQGWRV